MGMNEIIQGKSVNQKEQNKGMGAELGNSNVEWSSSETSRRGGISSQEKRAFQGGENDQQFLKAVRGKLR